MRGWHAQVFGDECVQLSLGHDSRTAFVAAGFHDARTSGDFVTDIIGRKMIQQMNKRKRRAEQSDGPIGAHGFAQSEKCLIHIQRPCAIRTDSSGENRIPRAEGFLYRVKHVNEGRI